VASQTAVPEAASAPPPSIAPNPLFLNLIPLTPPHSLQTGDSNVFANTTINSSCKEKVLQQQGKDTDRPPSLLPLPVDGSGQPPRNRHLCSQSRCRSTRTARRRYLRDRPCPYNTLLHRSSTQFLCYRRSTVTHLPLHRSSLLMRCRR